MDERFDEQLIADCRKGDEKALEILIQRYLKPIYGFAYRYVGNTSEAEDITQEVFVRMWRNIKKPALSLWFDKLTTVSSSNPSKGFNPKRGSFKTWIFSIAKNTSIDFLRKKKALPFSNFDTNEGGNIIINTIADPSPLPQEIIERKETNQALALAIEKLSPKYRAVLFSRYNEHFTFREIAKLAKEPINTVKSRYRRALIILRKILCA